MDRTLNPGYVGSVTSADQRNRVLRNTYWLLALSMVPTRAGRLDRCVDRASHVR